MVTQVDQTQRGGIKLFIKEVAFFFLSVLIDFINCCSYSTLLPFRVFLNVVLQVLGSLLKQGRFHKAVNYLGDNENLARTGKYNLALSL